MNPADEPLEGWRPECWRCAGTGWSAGQRCKDCGDALVEAERAEEVARDTAEAIRCAP